MRSAPAHGKRDERAVLGGGRGGDASALMGEDLPAAVAEHPNGAAEGLGGKPAGKLTCEAVDDEGDLA